MAAAQRLRQERTSATPRVALSRPVRDRYPAEVRRSLHHHHLEGRALAVAALCGVALWACSGDAIVDGVGAAPEPSLDTGADLGIGGPSDGSLDDGDATSDALDDAAADASEDEVQPDTVEFEPDLGPPDTLPSDASGDDANDADTDAVAPPDALTPTCPSCAGGYVCRLEGGPPRCVADPALTCAPCSLDAACADGQCAALAGEASACLLPCPDAGGLGCPPGMICKPFDGPGPLAGKALCQPISGVCSCQAKDAGKIRPCSVGGAASGPCLGSQTCQPQAGGWSACDAKGPGVEACNGQDDDCNAATDEGLGGEPCGGKNGVCNGATACVGGQFVCAGPPPTAEQCNGKDDDCDGEIDEALQSPPCGGGELCAAIATCQGEKGWYCPALPKLPEQCNGQDDDCDGATDESLQSPPCGGGDLCPAIATCKGVAGWLCPAAAKQPEACNKLDDDCDGLTDEPFLGAAGKPQTLSHCGSCGVACPGALNLGTEVTCTTAPAASGPVPLAGGATPTCGFLCKDGWFDANQLANDGCECKLQPGGDAPDGVDQDCDGVDGVAALAVFVAKTGSDLNPGTQTLPMRSLVAALERALSTGKPHVYVATGVYSEALTLLPGISLFGGYAAGFHVRDPIAYQTMIAGPSVASGVQATVRCDGINGGGAPTALDGLTIVGAPALSPGSPSFGVYSLGCDARFRVVGCQVLAGHGAAGASGGAGAGGGLGNDGKGGEAARDIGKLLCDSADFNPGGQGGTSGCADKPTGGGRGGDAICPVMDEEAPAPACPAQPYIQTAKVAETGQPGAGNPTGTGAGGAGAAPAGSGGKPGWDSYIDSWKGVVTACKSGPGCSTCRVPVQKRDGEDGLHGLPGVGGAGGQGCELSTGGLGGGAWQAAVGADGSHGVSGGGGGGGGAAGGVEVHDCVSSSSKFSDLGGSGGGGAAGGCGGKGGKGGQGGGASVAVGVVVGPAGGPLLLGNVLLGGPGGAGGQGGAGGGGGLGGKGGKGGDAVEHKSETFCTSTGGDGGAGGQGGGGGGGGGGCGGPSVGLLFLGAATAKEPLNLEAWKVANQLAPGPAGKGGLAGVGAAGAGAAPPASAGNDGVAAAILVL